MCKMIFGAAIAIASCVEAKPSVEAKPNVIIVITDDQGYGDMGCHGNTMIQTPHVDKFYKESVRFTNYHVDPTCAPSRSALMTGRYSGRVGVWHTILGRNLLRTREITMADIFKQNGYDTGLFGKWHLGDTYPYRPEDRGFTYVATHGGGGVGQTPDFWGNDYFNDTYLVNGKLKKFTGFCTDNWFDEAKSFIKSSKRSGKPFFAYISPNAPHGPFRAPKKYLDMYDPETTAQPMYAMVTNIDDNFAALRTMLREEGMEDNTLLVYTTDNGSHVGTTYFSAGMRGQKGTEYEGGHRVPWFMRWPDGNIGGGKDVDQLTAHLDILPTLIDIIGLDAPEITFDGTSLKDLIYGDSKALRDRTLVVESQRVVNPEKWRKSSVMTDKWRLVNGKELYNLDNDPGQQNDVSSKFPEVLERLRSGYEQFWSDVSSEHHIYSSFVIGSKHQNPTVLTAHDHIMENGRPCWFQDHVNGGRQTIDAAWMVDIAADGNYEVSIRRWPAEADQAINAAYSGKILAAEKAYLDIAGNHEVVTIPQGAKEITFKVTLKKGQERELRAGFIVNGERRAAHYAYILNSDIYQGNKEHWQSREGLGLPLATADHTDIPFTPWVKPSLQKQGH